MKQFFRKKQMVPGVYSIAGEAVMRYLIIGEHHALLFDTGYGFGDLSGFVKGLTDLPLYVVNSHGHIDHAGANFQFKQPCYMHPADMEVYQHHQTQSFRKAGWQTLDKIQRIFFFWRLLIPKGYTQAQYLANPVSDNFLPVHEGDVFDLGGVTLLVVEIPGHTPGSIGLLCPEKKLFFSGDGMNGSVWMFLPESTKLSVYCASIHKVQKLDFDYILGGHNAEMLPKAVLGDYLDAAQNLDFEHGRVMKPTAYTPDIQYRMCRSAVNPKNKATVHISADKL